MRARDNPFGASRIEALPFRFPEGSWSRFFERLEACGRRGAVVGPKGTGKTTLLLELAQRLGDRGLRASFVQLRSPEPWRPIIAALPRRPEPADALLIDGAEQLPSVALRRLIRRSRAAGWLVVTSHDDVSLPTCLRTRGSAGLLRQLVELLDGAAGALDRDDLDLLVQRHDGNLRACLGTLYDRWSAGPRCSLPTVATRV